MYYVCSNEQCWRGNPRTFLLPFPSPLLLPLLLSSPTLYADVSTLLQVDYSGATPTFLGWVVASYSFGQLIASPLLGLWADYRPTREPLIVSLVINIVFNVLYSYVGVFSPIEAGWVMLVARGFVGFGAGGQLESWLTSSQYHTIIMQYCAILCDTMQVPSNTTRLLLHCFVLLWFSQLG